ncbi:MAG: sel1 repeat family protein [Deltaproteobacteria bacterium]|nr:sel1 repeat family protein [Deltaproteobacteria bacterium]
MNARIAWFSGIALVACATNGPPVANTTAPGQAPQEPPAPTLDPAVVALRADCERPAPDPTPAASAHLDAADDALSRGDMEAFVTALELAAAEGSARAHYNLGYHAGVTEQPVAAREHLREALAIDPCYHHARVELGRHFLDGFGVGRNVEEGVIAMQRVVENGPPDVADVARFNLAMAFLHGMSPIDRDLRRARTLLEEATRLPIAAAIMSALPEEDPWSEAPTLDPPRREGPLLVSRGGDSFGRPAWLSESRPLGEEAPIDGVWVSEHPIALGVPEPANPSPTQQPSVVATPDCISSDAGKVWFTTTHTNFHSCSWLGRLERRAPEGSLVAIEGGVFEVIDRETGEPSTVQSCAVHLSLDADRATVMADWPVGCSSRACERRANPMGRSAVRTEDDGRSCRDRLRDAIDDYGDGPPPDWVASARPLEARTRGGHWELAHDSAALGENDEWIPTRVVDELDVCTGRHGTTFHLKTFGANDHSCFMRGDVLQGPEGSWVFRGRDLDGHEDGCFALARQDAGGVLIDGVWPPRCHRENCGTRISLGPGVRFPNRAGSGCRPET